LGIITLVIVALELTPVDKMTDAEKAEALSFGQNPDTLKEILKLKKL